MATSVLGQRSHAMIASLTRRAGRASGRRSGVARERRGGHAMAQLVRRMPVEAVGESPEAVFQSSGQAGGQDPERPSEPAGWALRPDRHADWSFSTAGTGAAGYTREDRLRTMFAWRPRHHPLATCLEWLRHGRAARPHRPNMPPSSPPDVLRRLRRVDADPAAHLGRSGLLREQWAGPSCQGRDAPDDARRAVDIGATAISVSNHAATTWTARCLHPGAARDQPPLWAARSSAV